MNRAHRLVWSEKTLSYVVAPEIATAKGKRGGSAVTLLAALGTSMLITTAWAAGPPPATLPTGGQVAVGQATIARQGQAMTVTQSTQNAAINWQGFSIGRDASVQFNQPSAGSITLNRVVGSEGSVIDGALRANGQVFVLNPNGVIFGANARVDTAGLVASTLNLSDADFIAGRRTFTGNGGTVVNHGNLGSSDGGYVALIGAQVKNDGVITARLGTVALASGNKVSLNFSGSSLVGVTLDEGALNALVANGGAILADGGQVVLSAKTASGLVDAMVNNTGEIRARTVADTGGRIFLLGDMDHGRVDVAGTLDASAPAGGVGGQVETSAAKVSVHDGARVTTASAGGKNGRWLIDPTDFVIAAAGGDISGTTLSGNLTGGDVEIQSTNGAGGSNGKVVVNDTVSWSANRLTLNAQGNVEINENMTGSGSAALTLKFGQGAVTAGNASSYSVLTGKKVDLPAGQNLTLRRGSDGVDDVYTVITTLGTASSTAATDLQGLADPANLGGHYALGGDINASATATWNRAFVSYAGFSPIGTAALPFTGQFEGLGHTVSNLHIDRQSTNDVGLFGAVAAGSRLANVAMTSVQIDGFNHTGAFVGTLGGTVDNVSVAGNMTGNAQTGGVAGWVQSTGVVRNASTGVLSVYGAVADIGGVVGLNEGALQASTAGAGTSVGGEALGIGGLVGHSTTALSNLSSLASVTNTGSATGGLVGWAQASIANGTASGSVQGVSQVGGLVGLTDASATVVNSQASGTVRGTDTIGGLVGSAAASIAGSAATGNVTGIAPISNPNAAAGSNIGGLVGATTAAVGTSSASGLVDGSRAGGMTNVGGLIGATSGDVTAVSVTTPGGATGNRVIGGNYVGGVIGLQTAGNFASATAAVNVSGQNFVGGVIGSQTVGFGSVSASGNVTGVDHVGGVAGAAANATAVFSTGTVSGQTNVGGIAGELVAGAVLSSSWATGGVSGTGVGNAIGGLVGLNNGELNNIAMRDPNNGNALIVQAVSGVSRVGGLVGDNEGAVRQSAAYNNVSGTSVVGGAVGYNAATVSSTTVAGSVSGTSRIGGAVGANTGTGSVTYTTASGNVASGSVAGGLIGSNDGSADHVSAAGNLTSGGSTLGGLVGQNTGQITFATATGNVNNSGNDHDVGGLVGVNAGGSIANSAASGNVSGWDRVGGLAGTSWGGITDSTAGMVNGVAGGSVSTPNSRSRASTDIGGLVGKLSGTGSVLRSTASLSVSGTTSVGGLVGDMYDTTSITDSWASGNVSAVANRRGSDPYAIGGLVGSSSGTISGSHASGVVNGGSRTDAVGGLVGDQYGGVTNSYATGAVNGRSYVGGLVGYMNPFGYSAASSVSGSYATGAASGSSFVGGLVGYADLGTQIASSHATGAVDGGGQVGGLVGTVDGAQISSSYATGAVTSSGSDVGGLVGLMATTSGPAGIDSSTSSSSVSGNTNVGGLIGRTIGAAVLVGVDGTVSATGSVQGATAVGGLVGYADATTDISHASSSGAVSGTDRVGGLVGDNETSLSGLTNSTVSAVTGLAGGQGAVGGIVGFNGGIVERFAATNAVTGAADRTGGVIGENDGTLQNASASNTVTSTGSDVGGAVGMSVGFGQTLGVVATGAVSGGQYVGGLIGENQGTVADSHATGVVTGTGTVGGFVGTNLGSITRAYATGAVTGTGGATSVGGFAGDSTGSISIAYATGAASGGAAVGGFIGTLTTMFTSGSLADVYATGAATGTDKVGGLVGDAASGTIDHAYAAGAVSGSGQNVGGFAGSGGATITHGIYETTGTGMASSIGVGAPVADGKTATEIKTAAAFADWADLSTVGGAGLAWRLYEGDARPLLTAWLTPLLVTANAPTLSYVYDGVTHRDAVPDVSFTETLAPGHLNGSARYRDVLNVGSTNQLIGHWSDQQGYDVSYASTGTLSVTPRSLLAAIAPLTKAYDGSTGATLTAGMFSLSGFVAGEGATVSRTAGTLNSADVLAATSVTTSLANADFSANVGTLLSNYVLPSFASGAATVTPKAVGVSVQPGAARTYDGGNRAAAALLQFDSTAVIAGDSVALAGSAVLDAANVGSRTLTGFGSLAFDNANYAIAPALPTGPVAITQRIVNVATLTNASRAYDGTSEAAAGLFMLDNVVAGETVVLGGTAQIAGRDVGSRTVTGLGTLAITDSNYRLDAGLPVGAVTITPRKLSFTVAPGATRVYDGSEAIDVALLRLGTAGVVAGDSVVFSGSAMLNSANAGNRSIAGLGTLRLSNANYALGAPLPTGMVAVTPRTVAVSVQVGATRQYDGSHDAQAALLQIDPSVLVAGDRVGLTGAAVLDATTPGQRTVTGFGSLGLDNANYAMATALPTGPVAITPRVLAVGTIPRAGRAYDGTTHADASLLQLGNVVAGDTVTLTGRGELVSANPGFDALAALGTLAIDNPNYTLSGATLDGTLAIFGTLPASIYANIVSASVTAKAMALAQQLGSDIERSVLSATPLLPNVVAAPASITADFGEDVPLTMVSAPSGDEPSQSVTLAQAKRMVGPKSTPGGAAANGEKQIRVPVSRNSLAEIVNGGVKLPGGVDQLLFVVKAAP